MVRLKLWFKDPLGTNRAFPAKFPVKVRFGVDSDAVNVYNTRDIEVTTQPGGLLQFPAAPVLAHPWKEFTLKFGVPANFVGVQTPREGRYIFCEALNAGDRKAITLDSPALTYSESTARFFRLPRRWSTRTSDWSVGPNGFGGNGAFTQATGKIEHTAFTGPNDRWPMDIGGATPVDLVLDPHWMFVRFEYFDRYYGPRRGLVARAGIGRRVSIPAITVEGFRDDNTASGDPPETRSNWTEADSALADDVVQCIPFINRRDDSGADLPPLQGASLGFRFRTTPGDPAWVESAGNTARKIIRAPSTSPPLAIPNPNRLKFYDLPAVWKSINYWVRDNAASPPGPGRFFSAADAAYLGRAVNRATPLVFCLDDMVLSDHNLRQAPVTANDRLAVFYHQFADRDTSISPPGAPWGDYNLSREGVYKPGVDVQSLGYPYSDIVRRDPWRYVYDYPDWTRLILAQGNLFDTFAERTPDDGVNDVVGARAAVRWADLTSPPLGSPPISILSPPPARQSPPLANSLNYFCVQPYHRQDYLVQWHNPQSPPTFHDEWAGAYGRVGTEIGRFDLALLRCCDWIGQDEMALALRYNRLSFDFTNPSNVWSPPANAELPAANPFLTLGNAARMAWAQTFIDTTLARYNGHDGVSEARPWLVLSPPAPSPPPSPPRTQVLSISQYLDQDRAHHHFRSLAPYGGSWTSDSGDGQVRVNAVTHDAGTGGNDAWGVALSGRGLAAAHEIGHAGSLPDDYPENDDIHRNYRSLHLLGSPYRLEDRALMHYNWYLRPRYLWHVTDWMRTLPGMADLNLAVRMGGHNVDYWMPHYPNAAPRRTFANWPVRFTIGQDAAGATRFYDTTLYFLGEDDYSTRVLPRRYGAGARVDGILIVSIRVRLALQDVGTVNPANRAAIRDGITNNIIGWTNQLLNPPGAGRFARFQVAAGPREMPCFNRALVYFLPSVLVDGEVGDYYDTYSTPHILIWYVNGWLAGGHQHSLIDGGTKRQLRIQYDDGTYNGLNPAQKGNFLLNNSRWYFKSLCDALGVSNLNAPNPNSYQTAASYIPVVRSVMDAGAPAPVLS
jgi:hypothetical protein